MDLVFRETLPSDIEGLFSVRARTRESAISKEGLASIGVTAESIAKQMASGRLKGSSPLDGSLRPDEPPDAGAARPAPGAPAA